MAVIRNSVLLLKAQKSHDSIDKFEVALSNKNFIVKQVKTLDFTYSNLDELKEKLKKPDEYSGLILSSPRCATAVHLSLENEQLDKRWLEKSNFTVGETTYDLASKMLGLTCRGKETGNANNLSDLILKDKNKYEKPFLFPHGNLKTDTLKGRFQPNGLSLDEVLVYETVPNPNLHQEFADVTSNYTCMPEIVVFFSPSGVKSTIELIRRVSVDLNLIKFIAIGPVTETAVIEEKLHITGVAHKPTPEDLLNVILN